MRHLFFFTIIIFILSGCGYTPVGPAKKTVEFGPDGTTKTRETTTQPGEVAAQVAAENARAACYQWHRDRESAEAKLLDEQDPSVKTMLLFQRQTAQIVAAATGNVMDPCPAGSNINDVKIAEIHEKNKTLRTGMDSTAGIISRGLLVDLGKAVVSGYQSMQGDHYELTDSKLMQGQNENVGSSIGGRDSAMNGGDVTRSDNNEAPAPADTAESFPEPEL